MNVTTLIFDLDSTLYPNDNGYETQVQSNILRFMTERLGVQEDSAYTEWRRLYEQAGQTLAALRLGGYQFETDDYWDFIRDDHRKFVKPDPDLRVLLDSLKQDKWVLTNCQERHAHMCLETLGLQGCFQGVLGSDAFNGKCKPDPVVYELLLRRTGREAGECAFFDDALKNVVAAKKLGMKGVLVVSEQEQEELRGRPEVAAQVDGIISPVPTRANLEACLPQLFSS